MNILNYKTYNYNTISFVTSAPNISYLPKDKGIEVAFAGRSNAGKSSALNILSNQKYLARTSKTPGCTRQINLFEIKPGYRLVDLPGYGYARASKEIRSKWQCALGEYLQMRRSLKGLVILMDIRHSLTDLDRQIIKGVVNTGIPILVLLTKSDKLISSARTSQLDMVREATLSFMGDIEVEVFSATQKIGITNLVRKLNIWFN